MSIASGRAFRVPKKSARRVAGSSRIATQREGAGECLASLGGTPSPSGWRTWWRKLSFCWCDPDASEEVAAAYRVRQFQALLQQSPLSTFNYVVFSLMIAWLFWGEGTQRLLLIWCAAVCVISVVNFLVWYRYRRVDDSRRCERAARILTVSATISALLFSVIPTCLFDAADLKGKVILVSVAAGFVAHGALQSARWPLAGILWGVGMCLGGAVTMFVLYGSKYDYLAWLTIFYGLIVITSVLISSSQYVRSLMAETKIDQQKQLISLLLNDFEDDASDWLWETDRDGRLHHASTRLAEVLGISLGELHGQPITSVLFGDDGEAEGRHRLLAFFQQAQPFRNLEVFFGRAGAVRWWSLSGKPLLDSHGGIIGWRGVGTDITAEHQRQEAERNLLVSREAAARVAGELDTARRIQMGLLPDLAAVVAGESRFSVAAILEPALEVGGDYYECFALDEKRFCFAVADVSGKGVPASLFMAMTKTLSASLARRSVNLGEAVSEIACELDRSNAEMLFVTTFVAVLDADSGELNCVSAGHDAPLLLRDGKVTRLDPGDALGPPMCVIPGYRFLAAKWQLQPGDTLCLFTDGATEATNGPDFYGSQRLSAAFAAQSGDVPVDVCAAALQQDIRAFEAGTAPADDLTIMALRWHGRS